MVNKKCISELKEYFAPKIREMGYELVDVEFVKEGERSVLRFYIDKSGGVDIDDCEKASCYISDKLDEIDPIESSYYLEVFSPGADRELKTEDDLKKFFGESVQVKLYKKVDNLKEFVAILDGFDDDNIFFIDDKGIPFEIKRKDIAMIRLAIVF